MLMVLGVLILAGTMHACSDQAEAHTVEPWRCKYLMWSRADNGERYAWRMRCESYAKRHNAGHQFQQFVPSEASWYGPGFYGHRTACGSTHTTRSWHVAALKPHLAKCGLPVRICSAWHRCVDVTVQDRGAWRSDWRTWDLSPRVRDALRCSDTCVVRWQTGVFHPFDPGVR